MRSLRVVTIVVLLSAAAGTCPAAAAQSPTPASPPPAAPSVTAPAARIAPAFDVDSATRAYLAKLPPDTRARSDAYFEGGYWLALWNFLLNAGILLLVLQTGLSARMRDVAERVTPLRAIHALVYFAMFLTLLTVLQFPLGVYEGYLREHQYGLSKLTFGGWVGEQVKGWLVGLVLGGLLVAVLYAVLRRTGRRWWVWGGGVGVAFLVLVVAITPVLLVPVFSHPTRLTDQRVVQPILSMARANGIEAHDVWEVDDSKQTTRISANVSGLFGTQRITLNDNLLHRGSLPEIEAVMGHEMGHYVLHQVYTLILELGLLLFVGFAIMAASFERLRVRYARWAIRGVDDLAGMPLLALLFLAYLFVITPVTNTITRTSEAEADIFGLNAARQPDGSAQAALDLSEYRKMDPGPLEEIIFYDHPSGRARIHAAMQWKAENVARDAGG